MAKTLADTFDDYVNWLVFYLFLGCLNLAMEAAAYLLEAGAAERLHAWAQYPVRLGILVWLVALVSFVRARRRAAAAGRRTRALDGYVVESLKRAALLTFFVTLFVTAWLDVAANETALPADFYIKLPAVCLTGVFSLSFLAFNLGAAADVEAPGS